MQSLAGVVIETERLRLLPTDESYAEVVFESFTPELGIWIKKAAHGHGYGLEAVAGLADWALANLAFDYLIYPVDRRNLASKRIPETLGGVVAAEYTQTNVSGNLLDLLEYRIDAAALAARRGGSS